MEKFCTECGAAIEQSNRFCQECGQPLTNTKDESHEQPRVQKEVRVPETPPAEEKIEQPIPREKPEQVRAGTQGSRQAAGPSEVKPVKPKGKGFFFFLLFIGVIYSLSLLLYPLLENDFPQLAAFFDTLRGGHVGAEFLPPQVTEAGVLPISEEVKIYEGSLTENGVIFQFVPAATTEYFFEVSPLREWDDVVDITLAVMEPEVQALITNSSFPFATGRQADSYSFMGEREPEHGNHLVYPCEAGLIYQIFVMPKAYTDLGQNYDYMAGVVDNKRSIQTLWGAGMGILLGIYIGYLIMRYLAWKKKKRKPV